MSNTKKLPRYENLPVATQEETQMFLETASEFVNSTCLYNSYKDIAKMAIADYIAYCNNKQLLLRK